MYTKNEDITMSKKAFVSGSTGFLGLNLIEELLKDGWIVYALHRKSSNLKYINRYKVSRVIGSINDYASLLKAMPEHVDAVFHCAANTSYWKKRNKRQYQDNVIGTTNMINCAIEKKAKRFIHTSSISAYGIHDEKIDENTPSNVESIKPRINYDITKYYSEIEVRKGIEKGLNAVIMNPCRIMGPYDTSWAEFLKRTYNKNDLPFIPEGTGMLCHVKDVARAHIAAVEKGRVGENYLLGGYEASFLDIINQVKKIVGVEPAQKSTPEWKLQFLASILEFFSNITGKKPLLTKELVILLSDKVTCNYQKALNELDYNVSPIEKIITDSLEWLRKENKL